MIREFDDLCILLFKFNTCSANNYQGEESETWIGEWMQSRGNRDQIVLATKYTTGYPSGKGDEKIKSNFQGNHAKSLRVSVEASLKKLQTDYIDLVSSPHSDS